jgi:dethiobiotin synthetase
LNFGLFFTGTDTGVGKTLVVSAVARILNRQGRRVAVCKPVATGAFWNGRRWLSEDTLRLAQAAEMMDDLQKVTAWTFPDPVAPPVAARRQGIELKLEEIVRAVRDESEAGQTAVGRQRPPWAGRPVLVEGIGGLLCPLTEKETVADLAQELGFPLVVVARRSLGTLNHTLLTLEAARTQGLAVAGVVVSETTPPKTLAEQTNVEELERRLTVPLLGVVPYQGEDGDGGMTALAAVDWWRLISEEHPWRS